MAGSQSAKIEYEMEERNMSNTIAIKTNVVLSAKPESKKFDLLGKLSSSASLILIAVMFIAGSVLSLCFDPVIHRSGCDGCGPVKVTLIMLGGGT